MVASSKAGRKPLEEKYLALIARLQPGDVVTHTRCAGCLEEHVFTEMSGLWICGYPTHDTMLIEGSRFEVDDISPRNVTHVNRVPVDALEYLAKPPRRPYAGVAT